LTKVDRERRGDEGLSSKAKTRRNIVTEIQKIKIKIKTNEKTIKDLKARRKGGERERGTV